MAHKISNTENVINNENAFQEALSLWEVTEDKKYWDQMWNSVYFACCNICKSKAYGIRISDLEEKALNATCSIMNKIKNGTKPQKLSSFCYLYCIGELWNKKSIAWDKAQSFDTLFDNYAYIEENDIIKICKENY